MPEYSELDQTNILNSAEVSLELAAEIHSTEANTPGSYADKWLKASGQTSALLDMRERVASLPDEGVNAVARVEMLRRLDDQISTMTRSLRQLSAYSGSDNKTKIEDLKRIQALAQRHSEIGGTEEMRKAALVLKKDLQSEIYSRESPGFEVLVVPPDNPEYEANLESVENAINSRKMMGQMILEDSTSVLNREPKPLTLEKIQSRTEELRERNKQLTEDTDPLVLEQAHQQMNQVRMGSSDTISGKSGGGELEGGVDQATQNWLKASALASEIAKTGKPITVEQIRELNRVLNHNMPANGGIPGQFREKTETAGGGSQYPYPEHVGQMMDDFAKWYEDNQHRDPIELAGMAYQKLVSIHPFDDANGRTCRLVVDSILQSKGLPPASYKGGEVNVAVFGQPQGGKVNLTPDEAIEMVSNAVERSTAIMTNHANKLGVDGPLTPELTPEMIRRRPLEGMAREMAEKHKLSFESLNVARGGRMDSSGYLKGSAMGNRDGAALSRLTGDKIGGTLSYEGASLDTLNTMRGTFDAISQGSTKEAAKLYARADELLATAEVQTAFADIVQTVEQGRQPSDEQINKFDAAVKTLSLCQAKTARLTQEVMESVKPKLQDALKQHVGPVLDKQGFSEEEKAAVLDAIANTAMDIDVSKLRDVELQLQAYAQDAARSLSESTFDYPGGNRVQTAVYRSFDAVAEKTREGKLKIGSGGGGQTFNESVVNDHISKALENQRLDVAPPLEEGLHNESLNNQLASGQERMETLNKRFEKQSLENPPQEDPKLIAAIERLENPGQPEVAMIIELAGECGFNTQQIENLATQMRRSPDTLEDKAANLDIRVNSSHEMADLLTNDGDHMMADVLNAEANEAAKQVQVLKLVESAKRTGIPPDAADLKKALTELKTASDKLTETRLRCDTEKRLMFQSELAKNIGPQLDEMELTPDEKAIVIKAVSDYALDNDDLKPNVINAESLGKEVAENLRTGLYEHPIEEDNPSERRIQNATRTALGVKKIEQENGEIVVDRPGLKSLREGELRDKLNSAKEQVTKHGPDSITGEEALQKGQQIKTALSERSTIAPRQELQQLNKLLASVEGEQRQLQQLESKLQQLRNNPTLKDRLKALPQGGLANVKRDLENKIEQTKAIIEKKLDPEGYDNQLQQDKLRIGALQGVRMVNRRDVDEFNQAQKELEKINSLLNMKESLSNSGQGKIVGKSDAEQLAKAANKAINKVESLKELAQEDREMATEIKDLQKKVSVRDKLEKDMGKKSNSPSHGKGLHN